MKILNTSLLEPTCLLWGIFFSVLIELALQLFYGLRVVPLPAVARAEAPGDPGTLRPADKRTHVMYDVVKNGENLLRIENDIPYKELARINSIQPDQLHAESGKHLFRIENDVPYKELARINSIQPDQLHLGQRILFPWVMQELPVDVMTNLASTLEGRDPVDQQQGMRENDEPSSSEKPWLYKPIVSRTEPVAPEGFFEEIRNGFSARVEILGFGLIQKPVDSPLNINNVREIPRYQSELDLRPDFNLTFRGFELGLKPRFELKWRKWDEGPRKGSEGDEDLYVHEGFARYRIVDPLILSYGRENLQWGPSYLFSPSNPFNRDNGRNNPELEVPALDYGRVIWLPTDHWTLSFIANTTRGRQRLIRDFERGYAVKVDYSRGGKYLTVLPSYREDGKFKFGFFGGWTVSDAFLLHTEGSLSDQIDETDILVGGSYTFALGPTIIAEYFHNQNGCTRKPFHLCFPPFGTAEHTDILFRKNYLLLQYNHVRIRDTVNVIVRWIHNFEDHSSRIVNILEYDIGERTRLFAIGNIFPAPKKTEFGSFLDYSVMLGVSFTF